MTHYKSWSGLNKQLTDMLCDELRGRITYFLTRYHQVHNAYGRASIRLDGEELVTFSWWDGYKQDFDMSERWRQVGEWDFKAPELKAKWDTSGTYSEMDFLSSALDYLNMPIRSALASDDYIIKLLAIMDRRTGKRTLNHIYSSGEYLGYPVWVKQLYELRFEVSGILDTKNNQ